ncbi:hypothetical protein DEJ25_13280 [Curtobacterium sp. MCPF17_011]|uniref:GNAT family N-acetyltransferase n=1 Tax=Curtobacterium sp. MCPF17_011 TaxID=2175652 RepID=UPI000DA9021E|nr:hypothetical protein DEJ25_13280 [Curtobacterium sp. MCPF17_011]
MIGAGGFLIGRTGLEPEFCFEIDRRFQRRGHGKAVATAVVAEAHRAGFARVWATVRTWNVPSLRALADAGFAPIASSPIGRAIWCISSTTAHASRRSKPYQERQLRLVGPQAALAEGRRRFWLPRSIAADRQGRSDRRQVGYRDAIMTRSETRTTTPSEAAHSVAAR